MDWTKTGIYFLVRLVLLTVLVSTLSTSVNAQYDSLDEYRAAVRLMTKETTAAVGYTDAQLTIAINLAANKVAAELGNRVAIDKIVMVANVVSYTLNTDAMHNDVFAVKWIDHSEKMETMVPYIPPERVGNVYGPGKPFQYTVIGDNLIIDGMPAVKDTLYVYYPTRANEMNADTSTAVIDETDYNAVCFIAASYVCAINHQQAWAQYWMAQYEIWKANRTRRKLVEQE